jgi:hypothetical protein
MFKATFNNISVITYIVAVFYSPILVKETIVPGENQRPVASH